jgi:mono/diheme cytochrome c family protein
MQIHAPTALPALTLLAAALLTGCGGESSEGAADAAATPGAVPELSAVELEQGIGPIRDMELAAIDPALADEGEAAFISKCSACHKMDERYVGPPLRDVVERRRPEFVMNMILNATEMVERHPEIRAMLAEYFTPMTNQVTDRDEARAILEYLREAQAEANQGG